MFIYLAMFIFIEGVFKVLEVSFDPHLLNYVQVSLSYSETREGGEEG